MEAAKTTASAARRAVNAFATDNFTASGASGLYHRARPSYPAEAVSQLLNSLQIDSRKGRVVEIGAGTGIFTQCLVKSPQASAKIAKILAVEPSSGMREGFRKQEDLQSRPGAAPEVEVVDGSFADIPVGSASVDLVVGAQCFHWSHPDYASSVKEFARVLKPGSTLALIWNLEDRKRAQWVGKIRDAYEQFEAGTPQYRLGWWKAMFDTEEYKTCFEPARLYEYQVVHPTTTQGVVDRINSKSYITAQPADTQKKLEAQLADILEAGDRVWIDREAGVFEYPYETHLYLMQRKG